MINHFSHYGYWIFFEKSSFGIISALMYIKATGLLLIISNEIKVYCQILLQDYFDHRSNFKKIAKLMERMGKTVYTSSMSMTIVCLKLYILR